MIEILVVGTTGPVGLGREICKVMAESGSQYSITALVRESALLDPDKQAYINELKDCNASLVQADLKDQQSLLQICKDMDVVVTSATVTSTRQSGDTPETVDRQGQLNLLSAAEKMGVKKFIYISYSDNNQANADCVLTEAKREVESALHASSIDYTILKPTYFIECWMSPRFGFDLKNKSAALFADGRAKISWVSMRNVAEYAVASINNPQASRAIFNLGGPVALSVRDIVGYCEENMSCEFKLSNTSVEELEQGLENANKNGNSLEQSLAALTLGFSRDDIIDMQAVIEIFPEIKLISVEEIIDKQILNMQER